MSLGQCRNCRFCRFKEFRSWYDNWNAIQMLSSGDNFASRNSYPFACMNDLDDDIQIRMTPEGVYSGRPYAAQFAEAIKNLNLILLEGNLEQLGFPVKELPAYKTLMESK